MKLYFLRHGEADWPEWSGPDDERPLTKKGIKEMRKVAKFLADIGVTPLVLLSSPLPRAAQTAEIVADQLELRVVEEPALAPGFDMDQLPNLLASHPMEDLMLVGHEPSFSRVIETLTGARVRLPKAGLARVDLETENGLRGELIWLVPPKISKL